MCLEMVRIGRYWGSPSHWLSNYGQQNSYQLSIRRSRSKNFTDGSGLDRTIAASAAFYKNNRRRTSLRYKLGTNDHHTVYEGEACGTLLATKLILDELNVDSVIIYTENHAVITATLLTKSSPGYYLIDAFHKALILIAWSIFPSQDRCWLKNWNFFWMRIQTA